MRKKLKEISFSESASYQVLLFLFFYMREASTFWFTGETIGWFVLWKHNFHISRKKGHVYAKWLKTGLLSALSNFLKPVAVFFVFNTIWTYMQFQLCINGVRRVSMWPCSSTQRYKKRNYFLSKNRKDGLLCGVAEDEEWASADFTLTWATRLSKYSFGAEF